MAEKKPDSKRLVQIAERKLRGLGVPCEVTNGGEVLIGVLPEQGMSIINPVSTRPLRGIRFCVEDHDKLRFTEPPVLVGMAPFEYYSSSNLTTLGEALNTFLKKRAGLMCRLRDHLQEFGFEIEKLDRLDRMRAILDLEMVGTVVVEADESGVRLVECTSVMGGEAVSIGDHPLDLDQFSDTMDLELFVTPIVETALREKKPVRTKRAVASNEHRAQVTARSAAAKSMSLAWLLDEIGPEYFARETLTLSRNLIIDNLPARLDVTFRDRDTIAGQFYVQDELQWQGSLTLPRLRNVESFLGSTLLKEAKQEARQMEAASPVEAEGLLLPLPGEVWVMDVQIDRESPMEIRYVALNVQGGRNGAPRVLPRQTFEKVFATHGVGYRMLVSVVRVTEGRVTYQRLNAERQPVAAPREMPVAVFISSFMAEAMAY